MVRADASEIAESLEIGSTIQVALIERQDKPEALPLGLAVLFHITRETDQLAQRKRSARRLLRKTKFGPAFVN